MPSGSAHVVGSGKISFFLNLTTSKNTHLLYHSFHGSGFWAQLNWVLCSKSHKAEIKVFSFGDLTNEESVSKRIPVGRMHFLVVV